MAGDVVGRVLPVLFMGGIITAIIAAALIAPSDWARRVLAGLTVFGCAMAQFQIAPRIARLRVEIGGAIDSLAAGDPQRVLFGRLHAMSVAWLGAAMLAAFIFIVLTLLANRQRP
jgi:hypothetical protein